MKKIILMFVLFLLVADVSMAQSNRRRSRTATRPRAAMVMTKPTITQVINLKVTENGYEPSNLEMKAGRHYKVMVTREVEGGCTSKIQFPTFGIQSTDLPLNQAVAFDISPKETGSYTFACGMNMVKGTIVVKR